MQTETAPRYMRVFRDTWELANELPRPQGAKLIFAMMRLFFEGDEPCEGELPRDASRAYQAQRRAILAYRRSVLNGMRNDPKARENSQVSSQISAEKPKETDAGFWSLIDGLPAETLEVGGYRGYGHH